MIKIDWDEVDRLKKQTEDMYKDVIIPETLLKNYYEGFTNLQKKQLFAVGITPETLSSKRQKELFKILQGIASFEERTREYNFIINTHKNYQTPPAKGEYKFLGVGNSGIVIFQRWTILDYSSGKPVERDFHGGPKAFKFSSDIRKEYELLQKIKKPKNVIHATRGEHDSSWGYVNDMGDYIELDYIKGDSLENILKRETNLPSEKVIKYSYDILNGLIEMRNAHIYFHRDIRPANIMIDEKKDRAIIIDLGIASTNSDAESKDNRRYGSGEFLANDLVSLGQMMYRMAYGVHLFLKSPNMSETIFANNIYDERIKIYRNKEMLAGYLKKVNRNIEDKNIVKITNSLLTAGPNDHQNIKKLFN